MANALTGFALYSALSDQVYPRAYVDKHADQPLDIAGDGSPTDQTANVIPGQTLAKPIDELKLGTNLLTADRFQFDNNYIYDIATGFVAMVTTSGDGKYTVTFRGTDAGDASFATLVGAFFGIPSPTRLDQLDWNTDLLLGKGKGLNDFQVQDAINLTKAVIAKANGAPVTVAGQSPGGGLASIVSSVLGVTGYSLDPTLFGKQVSRRGGHGDSEAASAILSAPGTPRRSRLAMAALDG